MSVVVTGASGFIGRALYTSLSAAGHRPIPYDLRASALRVPEEVDAVVHLAAIAHRRARVQDIHKVNVQLAKAVGLCAAEAGKHLVFLSSVKVHGEETTEPLHETSPIAPGDFYGESKAKAEEALKAISGLSLTVLRPPLVYGPGVRANFLALMRAVASGVPLPLASLSNRRDLLYVGNLTDAIGRCIAAETKSTFLVSDGTPVSTSELCRRLGAALGRPARLFPLPRKLLPQKLAASLELDCSAIRHALAWRPLFSMADGLYVTAQWYLDSR